jgi:hypothetical protein
MSRSKLISNWLVNQLSQPVGQITTSHSAEIYPQLMTDWLAYWPLCPSLSPVILPSGFRGGCPRAASAVALGIRLPKNRLYKIYRNSLGWRLISLQFLERGFHPRTVDVSLIFTPHCCGTFWTTGVAGTISEEPKLVRLARVPIRFQHIMTSQCSLPCIFTRVIFKITPYSRQRKPF